MFYILVTNAFLFNISAFSAVTVWLAYVLFGEVHNLQTQNLPFQVSQSWSKCEEAQKPRCGDAIVVSDKTFTFGGFSRLIRYRESSPLVIVINFAIANILCKWLTPNTR